MLIDVIQHLAQTSGQVAHAGFEIGAGFTASRLRGFIIALTACAIVVWAAWIAYGRFEAYFQTRIDMRSLVIDLVGTSCVVVVMLIILSVGA